MKENKMRVCRACHHFFSKEKMPIGLAPYFYNLTTSLTKRGVEHTVIAGETDFPKLPAVKVFKVVSKPPFSIARTGSFVFKKIKELQEQGEKFDLIHYHNPSYFLLAGKKKQLGIPVIQTIHGSAGGFSNSTPFLDFKIWKQNFYFKKFLKYAVSKVDATIIVSKEGKENLVNHFSADPEKVFVIPTGVDSEFFKPAKIEKTIDLLYVGRFVKGKNIPLLLDCVKKLVAEFPNLKLALVGGEAIDNEYNLVFSKIRGLGLSKNVQIVNSMPQEKLLSYYQKSKIFVFPSLFEGMPKVVLEAMACELPVVAFSIGGNKEAAVDSENAFLVELDNDFDFIEKTRALLNDGDLAKKLGGKGRKRAKDFFSWNKIARMNLKVYKKILEK